jgi:hypothetical protein
LLDGSEVEWLGNEVSCGVGMQRIDIMASVVTSGQRKLIPIELKAAEADENNTRQIQRYVNWIEQYYIPNRPSDVEPLLVTKLTANKRSLSYRRFVQSAHKFNQDNRERTCPLKYIEFRLYEGDLHFEEVPL